MTAWRGAPPLRQLKPSRWNADESQQLSLAESGLRGSWCCHWRAPNASHRKVILDCRVLEGRLGLPLEVLRALRSGLPHQCGGRRKHGKFAPAIHALPAAPSRVVV